MTTRKLTSEAGGARRSGTSYRAARIGLDVLGGAIIATAVSAMSLLIFHELHADFVGGLNGRIVYTALAAVVAAFAADGLFDAFFGGLRDRLTDARRDLLTESAKDAQARHAKAVAEMDLTDPTASSRLIVLKDAVAKAEDRALKAGVLPGELN